MMRIAIHDSWKGDDNGGPLLDDMETLLAECTFYNGDGHCSQYVFQVPKEIEL
jgi:hypothetical protein